MEGGIGKIWKNNPSSGPWFPGLAGFVFFQGWVSGIPVVRLFSATVRSAAESLARFGPPGSEPDTPSPGLAPGLAADRSGARCRAAAVLGGGCRSCAWRRRLAVLLAEAGCRPAAVGDAVPSCPAGPGTVACSIIRSVRDRPDQRSAPAKFPLHNHLHSTAYSQ